MLLLVFKLFETAVRVVGKIVRKEDMLWRLVYLIQVCKWLFLVLC